MPASLNYAALDVNPRPRAARGALFCGIFSGPIALLVCFVLSDHLPGNLSVLLSFGILLGATLIGCIVRFQLPATASSAARYAATMGALIPLIYGALALTLFFEAMGAQS